MQTTSPPITLGDLHPVEDFVAAHPNVLTLEAVRWQLRHRDKNGLAGACVRIGKRLFISGARYEAWLASQAVAGQGAQA